jgi:hypothetical protein
MVAGQDRPFGRLGQPQIALRVRSRLETASWLAEALKRSAFPASRRTSPVVARLKPERTLIRFTRRVPPSRGLSERSRVTAFQPVASRFSRDPLSHQSMFRRWPRREDWLRPDLGTDCFQGLDARQQKIAVAIAMRPSNSRSRARGFFVGQVKVHAPDMGSLTSGGESARQRPGLIALRGR